MTTALDRHRSIWENKPILRTIYDDFYDRIAVAALPGTTIEIGGGIGNLRQRLEREPVAGNLVATDIQFAPWLNCVANAQCLPFRSGSAANIVMVDVCHHLEFPIKFFREAEKVLRLGGRIIMVEPAITWGSSLFYRFLHPEPVRTSADPFVEGVPDLKRDPYDANQAIPTLIATREFGRFHAHLPNLKISRVDWFSLAVYPLSGGFRRWSLIPSTLVARGLRIERALESRIGRFLAFRMIMVIDKVAML